MAHRSRRGAAATEFGLWLPILAVLISGVLDISWMMSRYHNVVRAARDGARVGASIIEPDDTVPGAIITVAAEEHAKAILDGVGMTCGAGCTVEATLVNLPGSAIEVVVVYPFEPLLGIFPINVDMRSSFAMRVQQAG